MNCNITFQMILDEFNNITDFSKEKNRDIVDIKKYSPGSCTYEHDVLYIADLQEAVFADSDLDICFLCVSNKNYNSVLSGNIIAVANDYRNTDALLGICYEKYNKLSKWIMTLQESVIKKEGVQQLINLSDEILKTTITVMDSTYKLLAFSKIYVPEVNDEANFFLFKNGHHSPDTIRKFKEYKRFRETGNDIYVSTDHVISKYDTIKRNFMHQNFTSIYSVIVCNHRMLSSGLVDTFRILTEYIGVYAQNGYPYEGKFSSFDTLIHAFLDEGLSDKEVIKSRVLNANLNLNGIFDIYKADVIHDSTYAISFIATDLSNSIPDSRITFYGNSVVILNIYKSEEEIQRERQRIIGILGEKYFSSFSVVGISSMFNDLTDFKTAYKQAEICTGAVHSCFGTPSNRIVHFDDYYIFYMADSVYSQDNMGIFENTFPHRIINQIYEYDMKHKTRYVSIIAAYLICERNINKTSAFLNLHRNTVIYHITKLEELFNVTFDNDNERYCLLLEALRYKKFFTDKRDT